MAITMRRQPVPENVDPPVATLIILIHVVGKLASGAYVSMFGTGIFVD